MKLAVILITILASAISHAEPLRSITVKGEGEAEVPPDYILVSAVVSGENDDADAAKGDVDMRMKAVLDAIAPLKISDADLSLSGVNLTQTYKYDKNENEVPTGYMVNRAVELKLREISAYEQLVHILVSAGVDGIEHPDAGIDNTNRLKMAALQKASANAAINATAIAETLDIKLGSPIEVGEDHLQPLGSFQQARNDDAHTIQEILIGGAEANLFIPMKFTPKNIKAEATVWVRFEVLLRKR
jgi:uncharacterized protein YggE